MISVHCIWLRICNFSTVAVSVSEQIKQLNGADQLCTINLTMEIHPFSHCPQKQHNISVHFPHRPAIRMGPRQRRRQMSVRRMGKGYMEAKS